jgi:hypothetical protein
MSRLVGMAARKPRVSLSRLNQPANPATTRAASKPSAIFFAFISPPERQ